MSSSMLSFQSIHGKGEEKHFNQPSEKEIVGLSCTNLIEGGKGKGSGSLHKNAKRIYNSNRDSRPSKKRKKRKSKAGPANLAEAQEPNKSSHMAYRGPIQEEATFVDDFLDGMATVPNEIRRNSQLMRTLDKDAHSLSTELEALHNKFLSQAREKMKARGDSQDMDPKALVDNNLMLEIGSLFSRTKHIVDEKVAIAEQTHQMVADRLKRLNADLSTFEQTLHNQGEFDVGAAQPGDQVAFQEDAEAEWVLGRVLSWMHETGQYEVMDEDDNSKKLLLDEHQVIPLEGRSERLAKGDEVLAVYVDTTSFYHATIAIPPRGRGANIGNGGQAHVQFVDDADENGVTPHRAVPTIHIIKLPFGV